MSKLILTPDQEAASTAFAKFILNSKQDVFVLKGYAGTGKTTLVKSLIDELPNLYKTAQLINPKAKQWSHELTATTNKAAEALSDTLGQDVTTIHSLLCLKPHFDPATRKSKLIARKGSEGHLVQDKLIFIDEASYIDNTLLSWIRKKTQNCKIVFIGDPAQLLAVGSTYSPVFNAIAPGAELTEIVRQAKGNPIIELSAKFRDVLTTGKFFSFMPDGTHIRHLQRDDFDNEVIAEFSRPDWHHKASKVLSWTNKTAIAYNNGICKHLTGTSDFKEGDYAVVNSFAAIQGYSFKTEEMVHITESKPGCSCGIRGFNIVLNNDVHVFVTQDWMTPEKIFKAITDFHVGKSEKDIERAVAKFMSKWIDLRGAYSCTINKSQGSTYDKVYIDLDDLRKCNMTNQLARLLYVGVSRARHNVIFTGDLV